MVKWLKKDKKKEKEFEYKVIRVDGVAVAQGYQCPECGVLHRKPFCVICEEKKESK